LAEDNMQMQNKTLSKNKSTEMIFTKLSKMKNYTNVQSDVD